MLKRAAVASVVGDHRLQALILQVAVHVGDDVDRLQSSPASSEIVDQIRQIIALHGELIFGVALPAADADILRGLQIQGGARHLSRASDAARDDLLSASLSFRSSGFSEMNMRAVLAPPVKPSASVSTPGRL
jgi:hypothetical protein